MKRTFVPIILLFLLFGCQHSTDNEFSIKVDVPKLSFEQDEQFMVKTTLNYYGSKKATIVYANLIYIHIMDENDNIVFSNEATTLLPIHLEIKKGITIPSSSSNVALKNKGNYKVIGYSKFMKGSEQITVQSETVKIEIK